MPTKRLRQRIRRRIEYLGAARSDLWQWLTGTRDRELPPLRLQTSGAGDFRKTGDDLLRLLIGLGGLRQSDRVLDIGCGIGRVAIPLTHYLRPPASYDGFDVMPSAIRWCQRHLAPRNPHFRFHLVAVGNSEYRPRGAAASEFRFPFPNSSFDFVFATSVFTHLTGEEIRHYVGESARVLASGGRLLATFFLLNDASTSMLPALGRFSFPVARGATRLLDADNPGVGVAIEEGRVMRWMRDAGLNVQRVEYGAWSIGGPDAPTFQDVIVCVR
jgi:SAM-dependent methyltransferase